MFHIQIVLQVVQCCSSVAVDPQWDLRLIHVVQQAWEGVCCERVQLEAVSTKLCFLEVSVLEELRKMSASTLAAGQNAFVHMVHAPVVAVVFTNLDFPVAVGVARFSTPGESLLQRLTWPRLLPHHTTRFGSWFRLPVDHVGGDGALWIGAHGCLIECLLQVWMPLVHCLFPEVS